MLICLVVALATAVVAVRYSDDSTPAATRPAPCAEDSSSNQVALSADPRIAEVIAEATADVEPWLRTDECLRVDVSARPSATTAAEIARPVGTGLSATLPDLWIPDSSVWVDQARRTAVGRERLQPGAETVASTPVVIAIRRTYAHQLGWPERQPSWSRLLSTPEGVAELATADLDEDAAALLTMQALTSTRRSRTLAGLSSRLSVPLLGDASPAELVVAGHVDAIGTSEQDVLMANEDAGDSARVVASYDPILERAALDFPLAVLRPAGDRRQLVERAATVLRDVLLDPATQELFAAAGLRTRDGALARLYGEGQGVLPSEAPRLPVPSSADAASLQRAWGSVGRRARLLVVVDRSGSMAETLPGSSRTRADLAQSSLRRVVETSAPDSDIGLWSFTTGLPTGDSQILVQTGPLDATVGARTRRAALLAAVSTLDPRPGGGTPLYDTVLAGFRSAQRSFSYGRLNAVILVTDGRNQDPRSISLARLLDRLRLEFDGVRPVRIIAIAYGERVDVATLRRITDVTGGRTYRALTAGDVSTVFGRVLAAL